MTSDACTVAIVGYGPVGAAMANLLARQGIDVAVVEGHLKVYPTPRAGGLAAESMRLLQVMGLADELLEDMCPFSTDPEERSYDIVDKEGNLVLRRQAQRDPNMLWGEGFGMLQPLVETAMRRENKKLGVTEFLGYRVGTVTQDSAGVDLQLTSRDGTESRTLHADWVIGADGSNSTVRQSMNSTVEDHGGDQSWLLVHLKLTDESVTLPEPYIVQYAYPERPISCIYGLPDNIRLFEFLVMPDDDPEELVTEEKVWELLEPWLKKGQAEFVRITVYTFHSRTVTGWRDGRLLLAGDAAHVMCPELAEGLNSGFRDVLNLSWKLPGVINGLLAEDILDTYESERRPHVHALTVISLALAKATTTIAENPDPQHTALTLEKAFLTHSWPILGPGVHSDQPRRPAGMPAEQPVLEDGTRLDDAIGYRFAIVGDADLVAEGVSRNPEVWGALDARLVTDGDPAVRAWLERPGARSVVVRPDRLVLGCADTADEIAALAEQLNRFILPDARAAAKPLDAARRS